MAMSDVGGPSVVGIPEPTLPKTHDDGPYDRDGWLFRPRDGRLWQRRNGSLSEVCQWPGPRAVLVSLSLVRRQDAQTVRR
jgi:hypothetical protein